MSINPEFFGDSVPLKVLAEEDWEAGMVAEYDSDVTGQVQVGDGTGVPAGLFASNPYSTDPTVQGSEIENACGVYMNQGVYVTDQYDEGQVYETGSKLCCGPDGKLTLVSLYEGYDVIAVVIDPPSGGEIRVQLRI